MQLSKETLEGVERAIRRLPPKNGMVEIADMAQAAAKALLQGSELRALVKAAKDVADNWSDPTMEHYRALRRGLAPFTQGEKR